MLRFPINSRDIRLLVEGLCAHSQQVGGLLGNPKSKKLLKDTIKVSGALEGVHHIHSKDVHKETAKQPGYFDQYLPFKHSMKSGEQQVTLPHIRQLTSERQWLLHISSLNILTIQLVGEVQKLKSLGGSFDLTEFILLALTMSNPTHLYSGHLMITFESTWRSFLRSNLKEMTVEQLELTKKVLKNLTIVNNRSNSDKKDIYKTLNTELLYLQRERLQS
mmetsp:Transcript_40658/g.61993  ORF Transcript_40658/g.61993 Transcript_40658/m.61993 type:complete len:219 (+) Transcript_40658:1224-1880(+)